MAVILTDRMVSDWKPIPNKIIHITDAHEKSGGLELRIFPSGKKRWTIRYRTPAGRQRIFSLGDAMSIPLAGKQGARELARKQRTAIANGADPVGEKKKRRAAETVETFAAVYLDEYAIGPGGKENPRKRSWRNDKAMLDHEVLPKWKHRAMNDISGLDVQELIDSIATRGPILSNRVRSVLSKMFAFAAAPGRRVVSANPVTGTERQGTERVRDRWLSEDEIRTFWTTLETLPLRKQAFWKMLLLTARRPQREVPNMRWQDIDLDAGVWTVPGEFMKGKNGRLPHLAPLPPTAVQILKDLQPAAEGWVFDGVRGKKQHQVDFPIPGFTAKVLQKTFTTHMRKGEVPMDIVNRLLAHKVTGIERHYDHHDYLREKTAAMAWWDARLAAILKGDDGGKVLAFRQTV